MIIKKINQNEWQIKTNQSIIKLNGGMQIGDYKIPGSGEYEIAGIEAEVIDGISTFIAEDLNLVFISEDKQNLSETELKQLSNIDILFLPVAGKKTMEVKNALKIINELEPNIIIPIYYDDLDKFSKSEGIIIQKMPQIKISKKFLPEEEERQVIILE